MKKIEYRVIPTSRFAIVRYCSEAFDGGGVSVGSEERGEFRNKNEAVAVAGLLAKAEDGAVFVTEKLVASAA